jgi:hypothetical protein
MLIGVELRPHLQLQLRRGAKLFDPFFALIRPAQSDELFLNWHISEGLRGNYLVDVKKEYRRDGPR